MADAANVPMCLIIADGSLATLVAVWREAVCRPGIGGLGLTDSVKPALWQPAGLAQEAAAANRRIAQLVGIGAVLSGPLPAATGGLAASLMLLAAGEEAAKRSIGRVVWPVQFAASDDETRLAQVASVFDRALLAARLLSIDTRRTHGQGVLIHTPFAELADVQLMDLAADMDAPIGNAWWCESQSGQGQPTASACGKCSACLRWLGAMKKAGVVAPIAHLAASLLEEKPQMKAAV